MSDKIRILVGLNADKKTIETIQDAKQETFNFEFTHLRIVCMFAGYVSSFCS